MEKCPRESRIRGFWLRSPIKGELRVEQGDRQLDFVPGLQVVHAPGHTAGQPAFLWPEHGGVTIAEDACS
jgi:glyoxylase-like metal-dependent hydrolase (beta-lactamase superfamily II)